MQPIAMRSERTLYPMVKRDTEVHVKPLPSTNLLATCDIIRKTQNGRDSCCPVAFRVSDFCFDSATEIQSALHLTLMELRSGCDVELLGPQQGGRPWTERAAVKGRPRPYCFSLISIEKAVKRT